MPPPPPHREGAAPTAAPRAPTAASPCRRLPAGLLFGRNTQNCETVFASPVYPTVRGPPKSPTPVPSLCRPRCAPQAAVGAGTQLCSSSSPLCVLPRGPQAAQDGLSVAPHWLVLPCAGNATNFGLISLIFFPCRPLFIEHNTTRERTANKNFVESHQDFANNDIWKIEKKKKNALKTSSHQNSFVGTVFTRMVPTPPGWVFGFRFRFRGAFHVTSISVFISYLFHSQVYHGKCTDFFC